MSGKYLQQNKIVRLEFSERKIRILSQDVSSQTTPAILASFRVEHVPGVDQSKSLPWYECEDIIIDPTSNTIEQEPIDIADQKPLSPGIQFDPNQKHFRFDIEKLYQDGTEITVAYALLERPAEPTYEPKQFPSALKNRIGVFLTRSPQDREIEWMNRWDVKNKQQLTLHFSPTFPVEFQPTIRKSVAQWNKTLREILGKDYIAIQPNTGQQLGDLRYNLIHYDSSKASDLFAHSPAMSDPRTGQIIKADVIFYKHTIQRLANEKLYPPTRHPIPPTERSLETAPPLEYITKLLAPLATHELGHVLGLRHNFMGSVDAKFFQSGLPSSSVMDYLFEAIDTQTIGTYDKSALRVLYGSSNFQDFLSQRYLFCSDEQLRKPNHGFCQSHDTGTTLTRISNSLFERYEKKRHLDARSLLYPLKSIFDFTTVLLNQNRRIQHRSISAENRGRALGMLLRLLPLQFLEVDTRTRPQDSISYNLTSGSNITIDRVRYHRQLSQASHSREFTFQALSQVLLGERYSLADRKAALKLIFEPTHNALGSGSWSAFDQLPEAFSQLVGSVLANTLNQRSTPQLHRFPEPLRQGLVKQFELRYFNRRVPTSTARQLLFVSTLPPRPLPPLNAVRNQTQLRTFLRNYSNAATDRAEAWQLRAMLENIYRFSSSLDSPRTLEWEVQKALRREYRSILRTLLSSEINEELRNGLSQRARALQIQKSVLPWLIFRFENRLYMVPNHIRFRGQWTPTAIGPLINFRIHTLEDQLSVLESHLENASRLVATAPLRDQASLRRIIRNTREQIGQTQNELTNERRLLGRILHLNQE